jgi:membrane associated rhomboid family serine protease
MQGYHQPQKNTGEMLKQAFLGKNILSRLMLINALIFILVSVVSLFTYLFASEPNTISGPSLSIIGKYMALPSSIEALATKPWTLITYMFLHEDFFHLLFNLIMLYFGGLLFNEYLGEKRLLWTYLAGGIVGAVFFLLAFNVFPVFESITSIAVAIGASASVLAIIIAAATYVPEYSIHLLFIGKVKLKYIAIIFVLIDLLSIPSGNPGGHIAHLGGAAWGFLYAMVLRTRGTDLYRFLNLSSVAPYKKNKRSTKNASPKRPMSDDEYNARKKKSQEKIDKILDKISKSGYSSLTKEEKELLFKTSKKK